MARKQPELPMKGKGVELLQIKELDTLAEAYCKERDKRLKMTPREVAAKGALMDAMQAHADKLRQPDGSLIYRYDEQQVVVLPGKAKLRVEALSVESDED